MKIISMKCSIFIAAMVVTFTACSGNGAGKNGTPDTDSSTSSMGAGLNQGDTAGNRTGTPDSSQGGGAITVRAADSMQGSIGKDTSSKKPGPQ